MTIRTKTPSHYILPSRSEMREAADKVELKAFSTTLVEDICNIEAGGEFCLFSQMKTALQQSALPLSKDSDGDYKYNENYLKDENSRYIKDKFTAQTKAAEKAVEYHEKVQDFLRSLDFSKIPGSPLEKAMGFLKLLSCQKGGKPSEDGETLPIFSENVPETIAKKINEAIDLSQSLDKTEEELLNSSNKTTLEIASDMMSGKEVMLRIKRQLDSLAKLKTSKSIKLISDPEGNEIKYRGMKELSEIDKLNPVEFVYPRKYQNYRMIAGSAQVRERCTREEKKLLLYVICDFSGSMTDDQRFWKAGGVLMNRLEAVVNGDAEVFFSFFDDSLYEEHPARTTEEAKEAIKKIARNNFSGGGTAIADCVDQAVERINKKMEESYGLTKPELLVITDGSDDTTALTLSHLKGIKLHTFVVGGDNDHIVKLAQKSGGVGIGKL